MGAFFKKAGMGLLNILILPGILIVLAFYGAISLFVFLFLAVKGLVLFFTGRNLFEDFPEDKEAKRILKERAIAPSQPVAPTPSVQSVNTEPVMSNPTPFTTPSIDETPIESSSIEEAPINNEGNNE